MNCSEFSGCVHTLFHSSTDGLPRIYLPPLQSHTFLEIYWVHYLWFVARDGLDYVCDFSSCLRTESFFLNLFYGRFESMIRRKGNFKYWTELELFKYQCCSSEFMKRWNFHKTWVSRFKFFINVCTVLIVCQNLRYGTSVWQFIMLVKCDNALPCDRVQGFATLVESLKRTCCGFSIRASHMSVFYVACEVRFGFICYVTESSRTIFFTSMYCCRKFFNTQFGRC